MKKQLTLIAAVVFSFVLCAQNKKTEPCGTDLKYKEQIIADPTILNREANFNATVKTATGLSSRAATIIIPVVFHIFHNGGPENISKAQCEDAIRLLNIDYRRQNADSNKTRDVFKGIAADCNIEFKLATKDNFGRCTEGIVRYETPLTENGDDAIKLLSVWPADHYFNIWVVKNIASQSGVAGTILGYAQFPWTGLYRTDGVIIRHDMVGSIGTAANPAGLRPNYGRVLTHETGHWLGLFHTFQGGCGDDDKVDDTPPVSGPSYGVCLPSEINTCATDDPDLPDQYENYMDYSDGACQNMFSEGQKSRMLATINKFRSMLITNENLLATGVLNPVSNCKPKAFFFAENKTVCTGSAVQFTDMSYQYTGSVSYNWFFPGGNPSTSNLVNPLVTFSTPGMQEAVLIVSNANGSDTLRRRLQVRVYDPWPGNVNLLKESFESEISANWYTETNNSDNWISTSSASTHGSRSLMVANSPFKSDFYYRLITDHYDLSGTDASLTFKYSFVQRNKQNVTTGTEDVLTVRTSADCGKTWINRYSASGQNLNTVKNTPKYVYDFFPPDAEQWKSVTVDLSKINAALRQNMMVMFEFKSDGGNNFFLDDININQVLNTNTMAQGSVRVYPNPAEGMLQITLPNGNAKNVQINLLDLSGKNLAELYNSNTANAILNLPLGKAISPGIYMLQVSLNGAISTTKLMVK